MEPDEWITLERFEVRGRLVEKRSELLRRFLSEHRLDEPKSVEFSPLQGCVEGRCFTNVAGLVARAGGRMETGWVFWEIEDVSFHTEAHAIWIAPQGRRRDITPRSLPPERRILFLPDSRVELKRGFTAGYRTVLSQNPKIRALEHYEMELSKLFDEHFPGMGRIMEIPTSRLKEAASKAGVPDRIAHALVKRRIANFSTI